LRPEREEVHVRIEPERLHTWDFSGRMPGEPTDGTAVATETSVTTEPE
jgi:hypothetical protein